MKQTIVAGCVFLGVILLAREYNVDRKIRHNIQSEHQISPFWPPMTTLKYTPPVVYREVQTIVIAIPTPTTTAMTTPVPQINDDDILTIHVGPPVDIIYGPIFYVSLVVTIIAIMVLICPKSTNVRHGNIYSSQR